MKWIPVMHVVSHFSREVLAETGGIQTRASEILGVCERVLWYKLKKYGFSCG